MIYFELASPVGGLIEFKPLCECGQPMGLDNSYVAYPTSQPPWSGAGAEWGHRPCLERRYRGEEPLTWHPAREVFWRLLWDATPPIQAGEGEGRA